MELTEAILDTDVFEPGIHEGIPFSTYKNIDAANASSIKRFDHSPAHYLHYKLNPWQGSASTAIGTAAHTLILEPEKFNKEFYLLPKLDLRKTADKLLKAEMDLANINKTALKPEDYEKSLAIAESVSRNPIAVDYLSDTKKEVTLVWDSVYGKCKARLDAYKPGVIVDIKTTQSAHLKSFARDIIKYQYFLQAGFYQWGLQKLKEPECKFVFVAVENEAPFGVRVITLSEEYLKVGAKKALTYLEKLSECKKRDSYPGYPVEEIVLDVPDYLGRELENLMEE